MTARIPVYSNENNLHHIAVYLEESDGTFVRTQSEPLRMLRDNIEGISIEQGNIVASKFDKNHHDWNSPTVSFHYGRPQSIYFFMREKIAENKFFVFAKPNMAGRIMQLSLHELRLKRSTSQQQLKLFKEKYVEAIEMWTNEQHLYYANLKNNPAGKINGRKQRLLEKKKRAVQLLREGCKTHSDPQLKQQLYEPFNPQNIGAVKDSALELEPKSVDSVIATRKSRKISKPDNPDTASLIKKNPFLID